MPSTLLQAMINQPKHLCTELIEIFAACFAVKYRTQLVRGKREPLYLPANQDHSYNQIIFAHGFYASALHEVAHWCIAGKIRRTLVDFGYWYCADGRNQQQQTAFERVEIKPQALEWMFCVASNYSFNISCDNLEGDFEPDHIEFQRRVYEQVTDYLQKGIPTRAEIFIRALHGFYVTDELKIDQFMCP